jgi:hypothetical protein
MGERSATHRFSRTGYKSMGYATLTHPTIRPVLETLTTPMNDRHEAQSRDIN